MEAPLGGGGTKRTSLGTPTKISLPHADEFPLAGSPEGRKKERKRNGNLFSNTKNKIKQSAAAARSPAPQDTSEAEEKGEVTALEYSDNSSDEDNNHCTAVKPTTLESAQATTSAEEKERYGKPNKKDKKAGQGPCRKIRFVIESEEEKTKKGDEQGEA